MTLSGLTSSEYLWVRVTASETNSTTALTPTSGWAALVGDQTTGGGGAANMAFRGEFDILTGTTNTSDPTFVNADCASILCALLETPGNQPPPVHTSPWIQLLAH